MKSKLLRQKFFDFFADKKRGSHRKVASSSLLPQDDPSVLLTIAGMQQFKPYFLGEPSPFGPNVTSIQKCFRTSDIDEVGDSSHLTFFEMMGNFSFGEYFKKEAITWAWEFLTEVIGFIPEQITTTVFGGDKEVPFDEESFSICQQLAMPNIKKASRKENFWGPAGNEGPGGPTVEFHIAGSEIWNLVFNEFYCRSDGSLEPLEQKGVDTGMGLERLAAASQKVNDVFETDLFGKLKETLEGLSGLRYRNRPREFRVMLDHLRGIVFLTGDGIRPSNKAEGYILRRLLRRVMVHLNSIEVAKEGFDKLLSTVIDEYRDFYPELGEKSSEIIQFAEEELDKFNRTLKQGLKELDKKLTRGKRGQLSGKEAFYLFSTYGLPIDFLKEKTEVDEKGFEKAFAEHQAISRAGVESKFGGHGLSSGARLTAAEQEKITRLHTATHLLHAALKKFLGSEVHQAGSDITPEGARFDFSFSRKLTEEEKDKIETWVNQQIQRNLVVRKETMSYQEALKTGAEAFFREKYPKQVDVYTIEDPQSREAVSRELCGGPHVGSTSEIGRFKMLKEKSSSAGVRRIRFDIT